MAQGYFTVEAPSVAPARGGLLNVITPEEAGDRVGAGVQHEASMSCGTASPAPGVCGDALDVGEDESGGNEKHFEGIGWLDGLPFAVYKGIKCDLSGDYSERAVRELEFGEGAAVEEAVQHLLLNATGTEVLASGAATPIVEAVALLEAYAGRETGGLPMLHTSRYGATYLGAADLVSNDSDWRLHTTQGTPVVNAAGFTKVGPGGVEATTGQFWLYASGRINIWRGSIIANAALDLPYNENYALAERFYAVTRECFTAAVLVDAGDGS